VPTAARRLNRDRAPSLQRLFLRAQLCQNAEVLQRRGVAALAAGSYDVAATWTAFANRASNAPYRIYEGSTLLSTVRVDQRLGS